MKNYFKSNGHFFFFEDTSHASTSRAYTQAVFVGASISVWRMPRHEGPWHNTDIIGHRARAAIVQEIAAAEIAVDDPAVDPAFRRVWQQTLAQLEEELALLDSAAAA